MRSARALGGIGRGFGSSSGADLDGSGRFLMTSEEVWALMDGSGQRWTALDGLGSFEWQPGACSQLAESRKSCSYQWWEAYFVKSMLCIAEACSFAKVSVFQ